VSGVDALFGRYPTGCWPAILSLLPRRRWHTCLRSEHHRPVRQGESMLLDGHRLVVADFHGLSLINLSDDAQHATAATPIRDPAFHETFAAARVADHYLTVSSATEDGRPPYTVLSVPAPS